MKLWITFLGIPVLLGVVLTNISWGDPDGFHGTGFPFARVYWDNGLDHPNPYALLLNIAVVAIFLTILRLIFLAVRRLRR